MFTMTYRRRPMPRRALLVTVVALLGSSLRPVAHATSDFPSRPLKLIVGYAPGGPADSIGRAIARELEVELKQPVVVENRAGAAGQIGLEAVTQSAPDGYTLGLLSNSTTNRPIRAVKFSASKKPFK